MVLGNISVIITTEAILDENADVLNSFFWYNQKNGTLLTDIQGIYTLELPKLSEADDGTKLWNWLKLLMLRRVEDMEAITKDNKAMKDVVVTLREMSADEAERRLAEAREKDIRDRLATEQYFKRIAKQESEEEVKKAREEI